jgi:hypothetical protein
VPAEPFVGGRAPHLYPLRRARLWLLLVLGGVAVGLFPWTAYLSATLPSRHVTHHWDLVWPGFDLFEVAALGATVWALARCSPRVTLFAAVAATGLLCDAWFDVATAEPGRELGWALLEALVGELPLAALCLWISYEATTAAASAEARASVAGPPPTEPQDRPAAGSARARTSGSAAPSAERTSR